jgi:hypothetical protein
MNDPKPVSPRSRLQALLAVPERDRTDEQWDELNELEIMLASGNRERPEQQQGERHNNNPGGGGRQRPPGQPHGGKPPKKFHRRPQKRNGP